MEPITFEATGLPLTRLLGELADAANHTLVAEQPSGSSQVSKLPHPDYDPSHYVFHVPFRKKGNEIVGQEQALQDVREQLVGGKRSAIGQTAAFRGLGGLGKTQLAVEYAYRYQNDYPNGVIWINADQDIDAQLIEIAHKGRWIAPASEHKYKLQIAQQRLRSYSNCLIVFDNLDDRMAIEPYLPEPQANPHILVTSRRDYVDFVPVPLELLDQDLSVKLLVQEARRIPIGPEEESAAKEIAHILGGLPLALELAGAYLSHLPDVSFQQYRDLLSIDLKMALPRSLSSFTQHDADLYRTLKLSEELLKDEVSLHNILDLLTWSGSAPMSTELVSKLMGDTNEAVLISALALGSTLRLLQKNEASDSYSLHRLVREVRRGELKLGEHLNWADAICRRLGDWFQQRREDFSYLPLLEAEIDHLDAWQKHSTLLVPSHASRLMWLQAYPAYHRGRYTEARKYVWEAKRIFEELQGTDRELEANLLSDLAFTDDMLGSFGSVLEYHLAALTIREELYGEKHSDIANSLSSIGGWYGEQGNLERALEYSEQALAMRRELFRDGHSDIASSLNNVGHWFGKQGNLERALEYSEQALAMRRELFGDRHPDIANSLSSIGGWYGNQGNLERALEYSEQALAMLRELFGDRHPDIASSLSSVGDWYGNQGNLERALEYSEQALAMRRELFGGRHPDIASSLSSVGSWYGNKGNLELALEYSEQALAMRRELFGERHPDIARSLNNVGHWYGEHGNLEGAVEYSEEALAMRRELFGDRHPDIASSLSNVGSCYRAQGNLERALEYSEQALVMRRELFGDRHPDIARSLSNVGGYYRNQGNLELALEYLKQALDMRRELFGDRHPDIANSLNNVGGCYGNQGDLERALEYSEQALAMRRELFGDRHPDIARSLNNVGHWYGEKGNLERALEYSEQALAMRRELFGDRHPDIATSLNNVGGCYRHLGNLERALEYSRQAFAMQRDLFGDQHPSTGIRAAGVAVDLISRNHRLEAYNLVTGFLGRLPPSHPARERLQHIEQQLRSQPLRKGFRQPPKKRKGKRRKRS